MTIQFNQTHQAAVMTKRLLQFLKVNVHTASIDEKISNHPSPYSLLSISNSLTDWNIDNLSLRLSPNEYGRIHELTSPFVSILDDKGKNQFILVDKVEENAIQYQNTEGVVSESLDIFFQRWTGYALLAFPSAEAGERDFKMKGKEIAIKKIALSILTAAIIVCIIGLSVMIYLSTLGFREVLLIALKIIGILLCSLLIKNDLGDETSIINRVCTTGKSDCNKILTSKAAQLWGIISWSELGLIYFGGSLLLLLFSFSNIPHAIQLLSLLNTVCILFTFYSVWYQAFKAKEWCYFCLTILVLFWAEFIVILPFSTWTLLFDWQIYLLALSIFIVVTGFVIFIKAHLAKLNELKRVKSELSFIKYDSSVFEQLLQSNKSLNTNGSEALNMYGGMEAQNSITIVTSPTCKPCFRTHRQLADYINGSYDNYQINIIFLVYASVGMTSDAYKVAKRIISLYLFIGQETALKAMEDWYDENNPKTYTDWSAIYPVENDNVDDILALQRHWCEDNKIEFTPTIIINEKQLPKYYQVSDLKYFID